MRRIRFCAMECMSGRPVSQPNSCNLPQHFYYLDITSVSLHVSLLLSPAGRGMGEGARKTLCALRVTHFFLKRKGRNGRQVFCMKNFPLYPPKNLTNRILFLILKRKNINKKEYSWPFSPPFSLPFSSPPSVPADYRPPKWPQKLKF